MQRLRDIIYNPRLLWQIVLPYSIVIALVALVGSAVAFFFTTSSAEERVQNLLAQVARNTTDELVRRERTNLDFLLLVASAPANQQRLAVVDSFATQNATQVERSLRPYYDLGVSSASLDIDRMVAFDRTGKTYVDWLRTSDDLTVEPTLIRTTDLSGLDVVQRIVDGTLVNGNDKFSGLIYFAPDVQPYFYTVAPIKQGINGEVLGGVMIAIKSDRLLQALQRSSQASVTTFYDSNGVATGSTLLARDEFGSLQMPSQVIDQLNSGAAQSVYTVPLRQRDYRLFYSPLLIANSQVGYFSVGISSDFQFSPLYNNQMLVIAVIVALVIAIFVLGSWIANRISSNVGELVLTANAVQAGDLQRRAVVRSQDEIGQLAQSFNQMTEYLLRLYTVSRELNNAIEVEPVLAATTNTLRSFVPDGEVLALLNHEGRFSYRFGPDVVEETKILTNKTVTLDMPMITDLVDQSASHVLIVAEHPSLQQLALDQAGYVAVLLTPLMVQNQLSGLLILATRTEDAFGGATQPTLVAVANMSGSVLYNALLFDRVQQESSQRRAILQSIADGVVVCDRQRRIILANPVAERIFGLRHWATQAYYFDQLPLTPVVHTIDVFGDQQNQNHYQMGNQTFRLSSGPVVIADGTVLGEVIILHDITDEIALDKAKTNFIATISHELRSPLTVINGYSDLMLRGLMGELNKDQRETMEAIRARGNLMAESFKNLVFVANIESRSLGTDLEPVQLEYAIEQVVVTMRMAFQRKKLDLQIELGPDLPMVMADRTHLQMILTQLLDNARRYSTEGSEGTRLTAYRHDAFVHIEVIDTGMGIPPDQQSLLFTRFHRVEGNNSPERGLGLGLMITKYLVELQGGTVWAHSQLGQGSTFGFSIPIAHEREPGSAGS